MKQTHATLKDTKWARERVLEHVVFKDLFESLLKHPHRTWRENQLCLLDSIGVSSFWNRFPNEIFLDIGERIVNVTPAEGRNEKPEMVTTTHQNNVVRMICIKTGVYSEIESFRRPAPHQTISVFDNPDDWHSNLRLMLQCLSYKQKITPENHPHP